jgi:hypothetical protein
MGLGAFEATFGRRCETHRAGDHFLSGGMLAQLEAGGVLVDLTVEPGNPPYSKSFPGEHMRGQTPDYRGVPPGPYRSRPEAFPRPDPDSDADPLLVPLASAPGRHGRRPVVLWRQPERFAARLSAEFLRRRPPLLAFSLRSSVGVGREWDAVAANLDHLARHPGMRFLTASAVAKRLEERTRPDPETGELVLAGK